MRLVRDGHGHEWEVREIHRPFIGPTLLEARARDRILEIETPNSGLADIADHELGRMIDWADAWKDVREHDRRMRVITDSNSVEWLITEEGLPGETRAQKGGLCLRFVSRRETRYLCPSPAWWADEADTNLQRYLTRAQPVEQPPE